MIEKYQTCVDVITNEYTAGDYFREVYEAKKNYFENLGVIAEDDPDFENQMDVFMGWYLFDRPLEKHDLPPVNIPSTPTHISQKREVEVVTKTPSVSSVSNVITRVNEASFTPAPWPEKESSFARPEMPKEVLERETAPSQTATPPEEGLGRKEIILNLIRGKSEYTIKDISVHIAGISEKTIQRDLQALVVAGVLRRKGERRWSRYYRP